MNKVILLFTSFIILQMLSNTSKAIDFGDNAYDRITAFIGFNIFGSNTNIDNYNKKNINSGQFLIGASYDGYIHMLDKKFDLMFGLEIGGNINIKNNNNFIEQHTIIQQGNKILNTEINDYTTRLDIIRDNDNAFIDIFSTLATLYTLSPDKDFIQYIEEKYTETLLPSIADDILKIKQQNNINIVNLKDFNDYYLTYHEAYKDYLNKTGGDENNEKTKNKAQIYAMLKTGLTPDEITSTDYSNDPFEKYQTDSAFIKIFQERQNIIDNNNSFIENNLKALKEEYLIENGGEITFKNTSTNELITQIQKQKQEFESNNGRQAIVMLKNYGTYDGYTSWEEAYNYYFDMTGDEKDNTEAQNKAQIYAMLKTGLTPDEITSTDYSNDPFEKYINDKKADNTTSTYETTYSIYEKVHSVARIGGKYNFNSTIALQVYVPVGLNVAQIIKTGIENDRKSVIGFTTGVGIETILKERFSISIEYRYAYNTYETAKFNTHILQSKFGVRFL